eukprot:CAMPEP_0178638854 /NCGR_PEP_ID=MMETSP0698-20121128/15136_1 /TAXON_ID=265572 /ORGANISM="Extubocellulus spinifer, Strain CCMP396" /LENGTH=100 /DNA_ID=CAMNT_0020279117 /DNA_START=180 /DNA_END=478 /DNA_ORIENTATION=+
MGKSFPVERPTSLKSRGTSDQLCRPFDDAAATSAPLAIPTPLPPASFALIGRPDQPGYAHLVSCPARTPRPKNSASLRAPPVLFLPALLTSVIPRPGTAP